MKTKHIWQPFIGLTLVLSLILTACGAAPADTPSPTNPPIVDSPSEENAATTAEAQEMISLVRQDLSERLGISIDEIAVVSVESVEWPNSSLGCPKPGMNYITVITPGYKIMLEADGKQYAYHTSKDAFTLYEEQEQAGEPTPAAEQEQEKEQEPAMDETKIGNVDLGSQMTRLVEQAKQDLSEQLGISTTEITLESAEAVEWPDSSLGCPKPGMNYLMVVTPGYLVKLEANGEIYQYHADQKQDIFYCENPQLPLGQGDQKDAKKRLIDEAKADLARQLGITAEEIQVVKAEAVQWSDGSMGCPQPGMMYTQALVPGYQIILSVAGQEYDYHGNQKTVFLCER
jgi:type III secretory pathway component EscV